MNFKQPFIAVMIAAGMCFCFGLSACNSRAKKDAIAKSEARKAVPGIAIEVKDGIATIDGEMNSPDAIVVAESTIKNIENIRTIVSHLTVNTAPLPPAHPINPDQLLIDGVHPVLREYPGITASIKDGVVELTGKIRKSDWPELNAKLRSLEPKQILNRMKIQ